jgi:hypothetical protein
MNVTRRQLLTMGAVGAGYAALSSGLWAPSGLFGPHEAQAQAVVKAFPTAEGFGANSIGGRGGTTYIVTSLSDTLTNPPAGTFRHAVQAVGRRTIVFRVDGNINLAGNLNLTNPYCTIAFQTCPGMGIQLKNYSFNILTHDVIIRYMRWRPGLDAITDKGPNSGGMDTNMGFLGLSLSCTLTAGSNIVTNINTLPLEVGLRVHQRANNYLPAGTTITQIDSPTQMRVSVNSSGSGNGLSLKINSADGSPYTKNIILDHCECEWATDQNGPDSYGDVTDTTVQWSISAECLRVGHSFTGDGKGPSLPHSTCILWGHEPWHGQTMRVTLHHSLLAQSESRHPLSNSYADVTKGTNPTQQGEMINNVIYAWFGNGGGTQFGNSFFSLSDYNANNAVVNWGVGSAIVLSQMNIIGNTWRESTQQLENPNRGVLHVGDFARLYLKDNIYQPINGAQVGPVDGAAIRMSKSNSFGPNGNAIYPTVWDSSLYIRNTPFTFPAHVAVTTEPAATAYNSVLANVGVQRVYRNGVAVSIVDSVTSRLLNEVANKSGTRGGTLDYNEWVAGQNLIYPTLTAGTPPVDSDNDGVPNDWAAAHGVPVNGGNLVSSNGYTHLENYINELAGDLVAPTDTTPPTKRFAPGINLRRA